MRTVRFANGEFFHVYNRGVDKRTVFQNIADYRRFLRSLVEFNDLNHVFSSSQISRPEIRCVKPIPLVRIVSYCLMPNHYHFVLEQLEDDGIPGFMHRIGTGYTNYFNKRNERTGSLFQGRYKAIHINSDRYLLHITRYIHLNPLDIIEPGWKLGIGISQEEMRRFLLEFPWSSFPTYIQRRSAESVEIDASRILSLFSSPGHYEDFVYNWTLNDISELSSELELNSKTPLKGGLG